MKNDGTFLENFVRTIEQTLAGHSVKVENRVRKYDESGVQLAEFDLIVTGKVGSTDLRVLIECRDRPTQGAAEAQWIETMIGRRQVHHFSHVIAVSTTGFAVGARKAATDHNIELREVSRFDPEEIGSWIGAGMGITIRELKGGRIDVLVEPRPETSESVKEAMTEILSSKKRGKILITPRGGPKFTLADIWGTYSRNRLGDTTNWDLSKPVTFTVDFATEGLDVRILTKRGLAFIDRITFTGQDFEWVERALLPAGVRYFKSESGVHIGESVKYALPDGDETLAIEIQRTFPT